MFTLTMLEILIACRKALDQGILQAQQGQSFIGCYYRAGGGIERRGWGADKPRIVCAIGAALTDEMYDEIRGGDKILSPLHWGEYFNSTEELEDAQILQKVHDDWATASPASKDSKRDAFYTLLGNLETAYCITQPA